MRQPAPSSEIATIGKLRVATIGVRVLSGVAAPVGKFIAERLGVSFELVVYANPEAYEQSFGKGEWEIAIGPRAPGSGGETRFKRGFVAG
jgi:polar amino acid transport system substrate-binding protein